MTYSMRRRPVGRGLLRSAVLTALALVIGLGQMVEGRAQSAAEFYQGRKITMIVSAPAGGGYGLNARIIAKHLVKHIPGNPSIQLQFMPGAGGVKAANYLYKVAAKDGSVLGFPIASIVATQVLRPQSVRFKAEEFQWIGVVASLTNVITAWHTAPVKTLEEAKQKELILGATTPNTFLAHEPKIMNALLGTKFKLVYGYKGTRGLNLALERGEIQGRDQIYESWKGRNADWIRDKKIIFLSQVGLEKNPELPDVPYLLDLVKTPREKRMVAFLHTTAALGRAIHTPPGVPADRVALLRAALAKLVVDQAFIQEMDSKRLVVKPLSGEKTQALVNEVTSSPADLVAELRKVLELKG